MSVALGRICGNEDIAKLEGGIVSWIQVCLGALDLIGLAPAAERIYLAARSS